MKRKHYFIKTLTLATLTSLVVMPGTALKARGITINSSFTGGTAPTNVAGTGNLPDIFKAAADFWERSILDDKTIDISFGWDELKKDRLGSTSGTQIKFDNDGQTEKQGSYTFFIDATPYVNEEFASYTSTSGNFLLPEIGRVYANATGDANNRVDLFTVALHEIGHALGFSSNNPKFTNPISTVPPGEVGIIIPTTTEGGGHIDLSTPLMSSSLSAGQRKFMSDADISGVEIVGEFNRTNSLAADKLLNISGQTIHLNLNRGGQIDVIPGNSGLPVLPSPLVGKDSEIFAGGESVIFTDSLNKPNSRWQWQTRIENINPFDVSFPLSFFFPLEGPITGNLSLAPAAAFEFTIRNIDNPPEIGDWKWSVNSLLGFPIGIDTSISEDSTFLDPDVSGQIDTDSLSSPPPFSFLDDCSGGCSFFVDFASLNAVEDSATESLNFTLEPASVPEPTSTLSLLALGTLGAASTLKRKHKQ